jgi:chemotaxis protein CheX
MAHDWEKRIHTAVATVFDSMIGGAPKRIVPATNPPHCGLTAMIGLAGHPTGILELSCELPAASRIAARMLGTDGVGSADEARDALGEVCNMVAGSLKSALPPPEDHCVLSVPTVVSGTDYQMKSLRQCQAYRLNFQFEGEPLRVTLQIQS